MDRPFYSITFGDKNSWDEWALMPVREGKIELLPPDVKTEYVEIAGAESDLDMTEVLTGYPTYKNRSGSLKFRFFDNGIPVRARYTKLKNYLHGRAMRAVVEDDPEYYYEGRFAVGKLEYARHGNWGDVEISYNVKPYKYELNSTIEDWLWDPFNFETGIIREYGTLTVDGERTLTIIGSRKPSVPKFIVTGGAMTMTVGGEEYDLPIGTTLIPKIVLFDQEYEFTFTGTGVVAIDFRGGSL